MPWYFSVAKSYTSVTVTLGFFAPVFEKTSGGAYPADLYYAIHKFNFSKTGVKNPKVTVTDVYDFATEKYQGIQGKAVATMALAQKKGVVKKYTLKITV